MTDRHVFSKNLNPTISISSKVVSTSYDISITGALAITGAGFTPRAACIFALVDGTSAASWSFIDNAGGMSGIVDTHVVVADTYGSTGNASYLRTAGATSAQCDWASWDADGMTLTRTKTGLPTGTGLLRILFIK